MDDDRMEIFKGKQSGSSDAGALCLIFAFFLFVLISVMGGCNG